MGLAAHTYGVTWMLLTGIYQIDFVLACTAGLAPTAHQLADVHCNFPMQLCIHASLASGLEFDHYVLCASTHEWAPRPTPNHQ